MAFKRALRDIGLMGAVVVKGIGNVVSSLSDGGKGPVDSFTAFLPASEGTRGVNLDALFSEPETEAAAEKQAGREEAAKTFPIGECKIAVKDVKYTGKKIEKPSVKITFGGRKLQEGEDYTLSYDKKAREIGLYMLNIRGRGRFTGSADVPFFVVPKAKTLMRMLSGDREEAAQIWKCLKNIKGCQIKYSLDQDFSDSRKEKIENPEDLAGFIGKLKAGERYYVRTRLYTAVNGETCCSAWSKAKALDF